MSCCAPLGDKRLVTVVGGPLDGLRFWMPHQLLAEDAFIVGPPRFHDIRLVRRYRYGTRPIAGQLVYEGVAS